MDEPTENDIAKFRALLDNIAANACGAHATIQYIGPDLWPKYQEQLRKEGVVLDPSMVSMPDYLQDGWREIRIPAEPGAVCTCVDLEKQWEEEHNEDD